MSNLNDNNLDDLLRRAAEKYPLRTDSANFDKLVADLEKDPSLILPPVAEDRRRRRRFFWLFFLLPLAGGAYYAWHGTSGQARHAGTANEKQAPARSGATTTAASAEDKQQDKQDKDNTTLDNSSKENGTKDNTTKSDLAKGNTIPLKKPNGGDGNEGSATAGNIGTGQTKHAVPDDGKIAARNETEAAGTGTRASRNVNMVVPGRKRKGVAKDVVGTPEDDKNGNTFAAGEISGLPGGNSVTTTAPARTPSDHKVSLASTKNAGAVNIPVKSNTEEPVKKSPAAKDKIKLQKPKPSFYVGIMGSPDLSLIRFQSIKAVGNNFGLLLGYSFNSHWAVETGIYYDRKKYYTEGEYFSKSKVPRLQDINLKTVDGICYMWEIPLNVRYNFSSGNNKMKWFATGGLSTYLMSKENYTFTGEYGSNPNWHGTYDYKKPYQYWFSILNLSVGYEQRLGKIGNLRLEPFLRVPLAGIGTGSLSIMSAGLNIGITRRIW